jgi:hypothetical protein
VGDRTLASMPMPWQPGRRHFPTPTGIRLMNPHRLLPLAALLLALQATASDDLESRAFFAVAALQQSLAPRLIQSMTEDGVPAAIEVCAEEAPDIAARVATEQGLRIGRVSTRWRNPDNAPLDWHQGVFERFQSAIEAGEPADAQRWSTREQLPEGVALRAMVGLETRGLCLACHGAAVADEVREAIARRYPDDRATGFAEGDLRGAVWVEIPEASQPAEKP